MAKCKACGREMTTAKGCSFTEMEIGSDWCERIKVGAPGDLAYGYIEKGARCGDCGARFGYYHHPGCDMEACPKCGNQLLSCDCSVSGRFRGYKE